jgi:hypothetical protein
VQLFTRDVKVEGSTPTQDTGEPNSKLEPTVVLLVCAIAWFLAHPYHGIFHDARLYTLEALAHLEAASLARDVFLRLGSQDRFTIFGHLYAAAIQLLGTETAAAILTFASQIALSTGAWLLARSVMPSRLALYGLAVLVAIPGDYGAEGIFTCIEPFLTPRMAAEALTLGGLAAAFNQRVPLAWALMLAAALIHPLMACAGIAALVCTYVALPHPRVGLTLAVCVVATLLAAAFAMPAGILGRFDADWLRLVQDRSPWLFVLNWRADDWARAAVTIATLIIGSCTAIGAQARILCQASLLTMASGLLLTFIACDELHLVLATQLQPWRWQWLGTATAALLLPLIVRTCWRTDLIGRTTVPLLCAAWIFAANEFAAVAALAAVGSVALRRRLKPREARLVFGGACALLAIAMVWRIASNLEFTDSHYIDFSIPVWLRRAMSFAHDGGAPMAALLLTSWLAHRNGGRNALLVLAIVATVAAAALLPYAWLQWNIREFPQGRVAQFAPWRARIPPGSDVFWPELPIAAWMLLDRPSYLSALQSAGIVFSRATAFELQRRAIALSSILPPDSFLGWNGAGASLNLSLQQLRGVCQLAAFEFLVTRADLGVTPAGFIPSESPPGSTGRGSRGLRLYHCPMHPDE